MKFVILFTILSFLSAVTAVYVICRLSFENENEGNCHKIWGIFGVLSVLLILITIHIHRKIHSTTTTVICLIIAAIVSVAAILYARSIQNKIAARASDKTR